jgi:hypothetical protein
MWWCLSLSLEPCPTSRHCQASGASFSARIRSWLCMWNWAPRVCWRFAYLDPTNSDWYTYVYMYINISLNSCVCVRAGVGSFGLELAVDGCHVCAVACHFARHTHGASHQRVGAHVVPNHQLHHAARLCCLHLLPAQQPTEAKGGGASIHIYVHVKSYIIHKSNFQSAQVV